MNQAFFITGTDTGVGKTLVATALLKLAAEQGHTTLGLKPVSAGCYLRDGIQVNEDAWELMHASSVKKDYADINPIALREPMAPHIAAKREHVDMAAAGLIAQCKSQLLEAEFAVIEGAGGWLVPINDTENMADIAAGLGAPAILVVGMRLGCINHALLSAAAIRASGLELAGWVANQVDPEMAVPDENVQTLVERLNAPMLGHIPHMENPSTIFAAPHLSLEALLQRQ
jgi:dethiobiotin synthetase